MKIESQVCTLEQAMRLKALGVTAEAANYHAYPSMNAGWKVYPAGCFSTDDGSEYYPAYGVAELAVISRVYPPPHWAPIIQLWGFRDNDDKAHTFDTLAQACAHRVILMLESGEITPEYCNRALNRP